MGLKQAGFQPVALLDIDKHFCATLLLNPPQWLVLQEDLNLFEGRTYKAFDLLAGGLPCPPFSVAGPQGSLVRQKDAP